MRPAGCGAGLGVAQAAGGQLGAQPVLGVERRHGGEPAVDLARHGERGPREGADAQPRRGIEAMDGVGARGGQGHAVAGHGVLERREPVRVAAALGQQAGALAQRILVGRHVAGMLGMQRRHQPVEEAPALARPVEEQAVELRRQPDRRDMQAERGLALRPAGRRSAPPGAAGRRRSWPAPGRCRWRAARPACRAWRRPPRRRRPARRRASGGRLRRGAPGAGRGPAPGRTAPPGGWSCPRRWRPPARRARAAVEAELAVIAEIGQPELAHGQDGRRCAGCGVGGEGKGADRRRRHTRIGMST